MHEKNKARPEKKIENVFTESICLKFINNHFANAYARIKIGHVDNIFKISMISVLKPYTRL